MKTSFIKKKFYIKIETLFNIYFSMELIPTLLLQREGLMKTYDLALIAFDVRSEIRCGLIDL